MGLKVPLKYMTFKQSLKNSCKLGIPFTHLHNYLKHVSFTLYIEQCFMFTFFIFIKYYH